ncbi:MAG: hypothetical protein A2W22_06700 [Candidatus Levybacteria bacterium RBG_16_35_11]|nr:MAG: hypothetical protein A2W22_06700 [Candidatus Levybacteria bacterium RBG_16_35_11]
MDIEARLKAAFPNWRQLVENDKLMAKQEFFARLDLEKSPILPEGAMLFPDITIGGKTAEQLEELLESMRVDIRPRARSILRSKDLFTLTEPKKINLIKASLSVMGLRRSIEPRHPLVGPKNPTTDEIFERAEELKWDCVPAETVAYVAKVMKEQLVSSISIGMIPIVNEHGLPLLFTIGIYNDVIGLDADLARPHDEWPPASLFLFSERK